MNVSASVPGDVLISELAMGSWWPAVRDQPLASTVALVLLVGATFVSAFALRRANHLVRSLRAQVLAVTLVALLIGAGAAAALARLMVLESGELRTVVGVLGLTGLFTIVLVVLATAPLGRDAGRLEQTVRLIERGDRSARSGVVRSDELGHVAVALDELNARLDELERERAGYEAERAAMLSSVGHDLRTPLAALRVAIEALADGVAPDPERYVRAMLRDVEALGALVDDLFLLSRIEAGRVELHPVPVDLTELVDETAESMAPTAEKRGILIAVDAAQPVLVKANPTALARVVRNLLDNAIRHAPDGTTVHISVRDDGRATVRVVDAGPGFPPGFAAQAFDRFTRADTSRTRATGGAGLGLAIARGLIEAHGGRIWIEHDSEPLPTERGVPAGAAATVAKEAPAGGRIAFELPTSRTPVSA